MTENWGQTWRHLVSDSRLRWTGPEKGVIHLALGAVVNALWDLWAKVLPKPVWRIVAAMSPEEFVRCRDFRYISDAITPPEAIEVLRKEEAGKARRKQPRSTSVQLRAALHQPNPTARLNLTTLSLLEGFDVAGVELRAARTSGCTYLSYDTWPH